MWLSGKKLQTTTIALFLLGASAVYPAQQAPPSGTSPAPSPQSSQADEASTVEATAPVISLQTVCGVDDKKSTGSPALCPRTITRKQFEKLMDALNPGGQTISLNGRRNLAQTYAEYLAFESAARRSGMEDTWQFHEILEWIRLKTAADLYSR